MDVSTVEQNNVPGRYHAHSGLIAERADGKIVLGVAHGGDPFSKHTPVMRFELTEEMFASIVAHVSQRGETTGNYYAALALLQQPPTVIASGHHPRCLTHDGRPCSCKVEAGVDAREAAACQP